MRISVLKGAVPVFIFLAVSLFCMSIPPALAASPSAVEIKAWLETPLALLFLMFAAALTSGLVELHKSTSEGGTTTLRTYLAHAPETVAVVLGLLIAFAVLILTDQLNFASALGIGYGTNNVADLMRKGGRSADL